MPDEDIISGVAGVERDKHCSRKNFLRDNPKPDYDDSDTEDESD